MLNAYLIPCKLFATEFFLNLNVIHSTVRAANLNGVLLSRQTEGIEANRVKHIEALVPSQPRHDVCEQQVQHQATSVRLVKALQA
jgi:hypothetical protein